APAAATAAAPAPPAPTIPVPAPFGTPAFTPALAATVAVLARDGVQEARLALHPAELGPIAVQIALDGSDARVDFHASVAATRAAIEAGLPELASALRDSGLTLTGGGVFDQSRERAPAAPPWAGAAAHHAAERSDERAPERSPAWRRVAAGGVDEYA
ncbi:MAG TPA: flagellar hook-length control protein FliK, partial [Burkholderiaceae bacterium]